MLFFLEDSPPFPLLLSQFVAVPVAPLAASSAVDIFDFEGAIAIVHHRLPQSAEKLSLLVAWVMWISRNSVPIVSIRKKPPPFTVPG